jgi:hypothetical protein
MWCSRCRTKFNCLPDKDRGKVLTCYNPHIVLNDKGKTLCGKWLKDIRDELSK